MNRGPIRVVKQGDFSKATRAKTNNKNLPRHHLPRHQIDGGEWQEAMREECSSRRYPLRLEI